MPVKSRTLEPGSRWARVPTGNRGRARPLPISVEVEAVPGDGNASICYGPMIPSRNEVLPAAGTMKSLTPHPDDGARAAEEDVDVFATPTGPASTRNLAWAQGVTDRLSRCTELHLHAPQNLTEDSPSSAGSPDLERGQAQPLAVLNLKDKTISLGELWWRARDGQPSDPCSGCPIGGDWRLCDFHPEHGRMCPVVRTIATREPLELILYVPTPHGRVSPRTVTIHPVVGTDGQVAKVVVTEHDYATGAVTSGSATDQAEGVLDVLVGGIAHDFNNLLVGILGFASLAEEQLGKDHPVAECLAGIRQSGEQAARLTHELLCYARGASQTVESVSLNRIVKACLQVLRSSLPATVRVQVDLDPELWTVEGDPALMEQVVMNLCHNAADALGSSGGDLCVTTRNLEIAGSPNDQDGTGARLRRGHYARITVSDTGGGIEAGTAGRMFEPYVSTRRNGRGLGLAAVAGIVRSHRGAIQVQSQAEIGTLFDVLLPASDKRVSTPLEERPTPPVGHETVLILDDEPMVRRVLRRSLETLGYRCIEATNAAEAIELFGIHRKEIDLVVLDLVMPDMNGEAVFDELRRLDPNVRCMVSSGYSQSVTLKKSTCKRLAGFLQKPYTVQTLGVKIRDALKRNANAEA